MPPPEPPDAPAGLEIEALTGELIVVRASLVEVLRAMPESQAYRTTPRPGWTLKHELAAVVAHDSELAHVFVEVERRPPPLVLDLRRRRAEALQVLVQLRLRMLVDRVEEEGDILARTLHEYAHVAAYPIEVRDLEARSPADLAAAQRNRLGALLDLLGGTGP